MLVSAVGGYLPGEGAAEGDGSLWKEDEYEADSGSMAESFRDDVKDPPDWLLSSEPARDDLSRSLTLLKCPAMGARSVGRRGDAFHKAVHPAVQSLSQITTMYELLEACRCQEHLLPCTSQDMAQKEDGGNAKHLLQCRQRWKWWRVCTARMHARVSLSLYRSLSFSEAAEVHGGTHTPANITIGFLNLLHDILRSPISDIRKCFCLHFIVWQLKRGVNMGTANEEANGLTLLADSLNAFVTEGSSVSCSSWLVSYMRWSSVCWQDTVDRQEAIFLPTANLCSSEPQPCTPTALSCAAGYIG